MRILAFILLTALTPAIFAQNLVEFGAAAAAGTVGGAGGKPLSNGLTAIFNKVDLQAAKAAGKETKEAKETAALKIGPEVPKADTGDVPPPPSMPARRAATDLSLPAASPVIPIEATRMLTLSEAVPALPPPPVMSPDDFRTLSSGTSRAEVLKLGAPASKITMFEAGHLVEVYTYRQNGQTFGTLHLTDGAVASVIAN